MRRSPLVVVVGETAAGKSALSMRLAKQFNGEVISADSRTVYKGMDIGTAKPTKQDQAAVPHHLIDITTPDQPVTAAVFKRLALEAIDDIAARGKLPILAGGSGLYIDSVLYDYQFRSPQTNAREVLNKKSVTELQLMLLERGIELPANDRNPRHLIRALETDGLVAAKRELRADTLILGLQPDREELRQKITERVEAMIEAGLVKEIRQLFKTYGSDLEPFQAPAYKAFRAYLEGSESLENAKASFIQNDMALAKRQRTWLKRNKSIHWFTTPVNWQDVVDLITTFLKT